MSALHSKLVELFNNESNNMWQGQHLSEKAMGEILEALLKLKWIIVFTLLVPILFIYN